MSNGRNDSAERAAVTLASVMIVLVIGSGWKGKGGIDGRLEILRGQNEKSETELGVEKVYGSMS